jgi:hypothetical protein
MVFITSLILLFKSSYISHCFFCNFNTSNNSELFKLKYFTDVASSHVIVLNIFNELLCPRKATV